MTGSIFDTFTDAEYAEMYVELDLRAQLIAIRHFLGRSEASKAAVIAEIDGLAAKAKAASGDHADHLVDLWVDEMHGSVFHDGVNSLAAVGMFAPLVEALFVQMFRALSKREEGRAPPHLREQRVAADLWDPHFFFRKAGRDENLVEGILQLSDMTGLAPRLPADTRAVLEALFGYRNAMLHNGLEWPMEWREKFENRTGSWPAEWFSSSRSGELPWIFYMTPTFIDRCLIFVEQVMAAFGGLIRHRDDAASV